MIFEWTFVFSSTIDYNDGQGPAKELRTQEDKVAELRSNNLVLGSAEDNVCPVCWRHQPGRSDDSGQERDQDQCWPALGSGARLVCQY